jgi:CRISPR-associated protein Csx10
MPRFKIVVEAQEPVLLGDSLALGNVQSSRPFVAGSVLRGVLAQAILSPLGLWQHSGRPLSQDPLPGGFAQVFLGDLPARFGFLYPVRSRWEEAVRTEAFPLPLTAWTCKAREGFQSDDGHGVIDALLGGLYRVVGEERPRVKLCPECEERLERFRGYAVRFTGNGAHTKAQVAPHTFVRVGLNRGTETAEEAILYTLEALVPGPGGKGQVSPLSFVGYWTMSDDQWQALRALLAAHIPAKEGTYPLRIGTARARGMGAVNLHLPEAPGPRPAMEERLEAFQPRRPSGTLLDAMHLYFALTLRSPLLVRDATGRLTTRMGAETLKAYLDAIPQGLEPLPKASVVEQETWSGWSAAWGLPKPVTPAMAAGSVLAFRAPTRERDAVLAFLQEVEERGLGERLAEGWGEVVACDPFHVHFTPEENDEHQDH